MTTFQEFIGSEGHVPAWPYAIRYDKEQEIEAVRAFMETNAKNSIRLVTKAIMKIFFFLP